MHDEFVEMASAYIEKTEKLMEKHVRLEKRRDEKYKVFIEKAYNKIGKLMLFLFAYFAFTTVFCFFYTPAYLVLFCPFIFMSFLYIGSLIDNNKFYFRIGRWKSLFLYVNNKNKLQNQFYDKVFLYNFICYLKCIFTDTPLTDIHVKIKERGKVELVIGDGQVFVETVVQLTNVLVEKQHILELYQEKLNQ